MPPHWPLAQDKARYEGDAVAVVVAESRAAALDAAELVQVEWEQLPAVTDVAHALDEGAPLVHDNLPSNKCYVWPLEGGDVAKAFADAEVTVSERYRQQRLIPAAIEPRGVLAQSLNGDRRADALVGHAGAAHPAASRSPGCSACPRRSSA